ncbi:MAG: isoaspartyl peptidase/L-asparaginase [Actinomycetota bacterium]
MSVVYVHGGVSGVRKHELPSLAYAIRAAAMGRGGLDLVEHAVRALEDDAALNAGWGSVVDLSGEPSLDAGIADGSIGRAGAVAGVTVRHPISLARRVLERTPHVLLVGAGAMELGADLELLHGTTEEQLSRWLKAARSGDLHHATYGSPEHVDTVGAVALDDSGCLAAGSSTGGVFGKMRGRVGDSPVFGAGFYASRIAAVVGTGVGELFLETLASLRCGELIEQGMEPQLACEETVGLLGERSEVAAGLLALDVRGRVGAVFRGGSWAVEGPDGPLRAIRIE